MHSGVHIFCFRSEIPFLRKLASKNQNCYFKLKFGIWHNLNMQNSIVLFTFSVFDEQVLSKKPIWYFDVAWVIYQQFTRRDLRLVSTRIWKSSMPLSRNSKVCETVKFVNVKSKPVLLKECHTIHVILKSLSWLFINVYNGFTS